jgi:FixJ family two-component response regulator
MITLVDDDPCILAATASLLRSLGYSVSTFASARALLDSAELLETRCLIADVMMPEIDGFELQRRLARNGHRFPIIFLTAISEEATKARLVHDGAFCVLSKPCPEDRLIDCLESAMRGPSQ